MKNNKIKLININQNDINCHFISGKELINESYKTYLTDESKFSGTIPDKIYFPRSTEETAKAILEINNAKETLSVSGSRTGITGGSVPLNIKNIISTENIILKPVLKYHEHSNQWTLKVGSGAKLNEINSYIINKNYLTNDKLTVKLFYPVDPTETNASAGGMASTNASGARTFFYGPTRNWIKGLTIVLSDGSILKINRGECFFIENKVFLENTNNNLIKEIKIDKIKMPDVKHSAGYYLKNKMDLIDMFIGQEGTLGIITEVELILSEVPDNPLYLSVFLNKENPVDFVKDIKKNKKLKPLSIEFIDNHSINLLKEFRKEQKEAAGIPDLPEKIKGLIYLEFTFQDTNDFNNIYKEIKKILIKNKLNITDTWAGLSEKDLTEMKKFRHNVPEKINSIIALKKLKIPQLTKVGTDMSVPDKALKKIYNHYIKVLDKNKLEYYIFGHIGNAHLHVNIIPKDIDELQRAKKLYLLFAKKAVSLKGSVSAEHGIGRLKKDFLKIQFTKKEIDIMINIKKQLDPDNILNPGVLW